MRPLYSCANLLVILSGLVVGTSCYASKPYLDKNRVAYISKIIQAFNETSIHDIYNTYRYINVVEKNNCRTSLSDLKVECLLTYAKNNCSEVGGDKIKENCELYSDIIVVNKLSENSFVNRTERYGILKNTGDDFRTAMASRLQQKYARIVTHFSLTKFSNCGKNDFDCLAKGLDEFCLGYTNSQSLSWQYCMSASLWFIGIAK